LFSVAEFASSNIGTVRAARRFCRVAEPLPPLVKNSLEVAWNYLDGLGEISDPQNTAEFLLRSIQSQILMGETRTLSSRTGRSQPTNGGLSSSHDRSEMSRLLWPGLGVRKSPETGFGTREAVSAGQGCRVVVSGLASKNLTPRRLFLASNGFKFPTSPNFCS
jgi:hypothetical protein